MAKRKTRTKKNSRNNVNFSNPKVQSIVSYLQLGENRISKSEIMSLGNKDIFYSLKNSGYIKQSSKGEFQGTQKLHTHVKKTEGKLFSSSASSAHAQAVRNSLALLPSSVLTRKSYHSSSDVEKYFEKKIKPSQEYKEELYRMKQDCKEQLRQIEYAYAASQTEQQSDYERYCSKMDYIHDKDSVTGRMEWLEDKTCLIPDYQVSLNQNELNQYIENLSDYRDSLDTDSKACHFYEDSIRKLQNISIQEGEITLSVEIVTDSYGQKELELHKNFEVLSHTPQILLM